jgi:retinol dehydrogenase 12
MWPFTLAPGIAFDPQNDIPSLVGKVILVTGANSGLGAATALELARHGPAQVWLLARSLESAQATIDSIHATLPDAPLFPLACDLGSFASVHAAAKHFLSRAGRLDILVLNAGVMWRPEGQTESGYEIHFGINHMGHALLTSLLLPLLVRTADAGADVRVVSVTSAALAKPPEGSIQFDTLQTAGSGLPSFSRYAQSKLANALFARELARRYPQLTTAACHPGLVMTQLGRTLEEERPWLRIFAPVAWLFLSTPAGGAKNQLWAATGKGVVSGEYYEPVGAVVDRGAWVRDDELARKLWEWTERELRSWIEENGSA